MNAGGCVELRLLDPYSAAADEYIGCPDADDAGRRSGGRRADDNRVVRDSDRVPEVIGDVCIGGFEKRLLAPNLIPFRCFAAHEHIRGARLGGGPVLLPAASVDWKGAPTTAVFPEIATEYPNRSCAAVFDALR